MGQEPAVAEQAGQEPTAPESKEGQEPQAEPKGESRTFDADYVRQLRDEAAKHRKEAQEAKAKAQEYEDAQKSELEKANTKAERAEKAKADAEAKLLRYDVARDKEVPAKLVPLLTATSREDLEAQADLLLENAKPASPDFDGGARDTAPEPKSPEEAHNELIGKLFGREPT